MPFKADVIRILIASPGDVEEERRVIPEVLNDWNAMHAFNNNIILMPAKWETNSAPLLGGRPQEIINAQMVKDCDILVGIFWTRLGTHTGISVSGTAEEIEQFVALQKPVMLYFSQSPISPEAIDIEQFTALKKFREKMRLEGLTESFSSLPDFREKFQRQLSINLNSIVANMRAAVKGSSLIKSETEVDSFSHLSLQSTPKKKISDAEVIDFLRDAITATADGNGWAHIAPLGKYLKTYTPVNYSTLGFDKLSNMFKHYDKSFEIRHEQKSANATGIDSMYVRMRT